MAFASPTGTGYDVEQLQMPNRRQGGSLAGLRSAMSKYGQQATQAGNAQSIAHGGRDDDPLGLNMQARGVATQQADRDASDPRFASGPLIDPKWAGLFQAISETGAHGIDGRLGAEGNVAALPDAAGMQSARPQSNQFVGRSVQPSPLVGRRRR